MSRPNNPDPGLTSAINRRACTSVTRNACPGAAAWPSEDTTSTPDETSGPTAAAASDEELATVAVEVLASTVGLAGAVGLAFADVGAGEAEGELLQAVAPATSANTTHTQVPPDRRATR